MNFTKDTPYSTIEQMVREAVYKKMNLDVPTPKTGPNPLVVNISARHVHLTPQALEALFGKGYKLSVHKWLYQEGFFAAKESVTLIGPRSRIISNLRILGPCSFFPYYFQLFERRFIQQRLVYSYYFLEIHIFFM